VNGWERTELTHQGNPVMRHRKTGELAMEVLQEGRQVELPRHVEAALRQALQMTELARWLVAGSEEAR
jgi:hypothetical protein